MPFTQVTNKKQLGFTLVEVLIISPIALLTIAVFIGSIIFITGEALSARVQNTLAYTVQDALDNIENDINLSGAFLATNNVALTSPQGFDNTTQNFINASTTTGTALILNTSAVSNASSITARQTIPLRDLPHDCSSDRISQNEIMTYNIIYFIKDGSLWRRDVLPSNYQTRGCNGLQPWSRPTCAEASIGGFCATRDTLLLSNIAATGFTIRYYSSSDSTTEITDASNVSAPTATRQLGLDDADTADITLTGTAVVSGRTIEYTGSARSTRINQLMKYVTPVP